MKQVLVLIHTVSPLIGVFKRLLDEMLPDIQAMHILDEPLLEIIRRRGRLAAEDEDRLLGHIVAAQEVGAVAVLVTCSTVSPCVDSVRQRIEVPVFKIDEAMVAEAVERGSRIGVVATNATTLEPARQLLERQAEQAGKRIHTELVLVPDALSALMQGNGVMHDALVKQVVLDVAPRCDVIILAQASMARVQACISPSESPIPILSSPYLALVQVRQYLERAQGVARA